MTALWLNGALHPAADARIAPEDRGLLLADGLFETLRIHDGRPLHWPRHLRRLADSAATLAIPMPYPGDTLHDAIAAVCAANQVGHGSARLTLTRGPGPRGLAPPDHPTPTLLVTAAPGAAPATPLAAIIARTTRRNEFSPLSRLKTLNYGDSLLARREATARGADEAVLLNTAGRLAETTIATLVVLQGTTLLTPPLSDGALPGIARALLIERCGLQESSLRPDHPADAMFAASSLSIRALSRLDDTPFAPRDDLLATLRAATAAE